MQGRILSGTALAVMIAGGWAIVATGADGPKGPQPARHLPGLATRTHESRENQKLDAILANQHKLFERLDTFEETLPNQAFTVQSAILDAVAANHAAVLDAIGGLQAQCSMSDLLPLPEPGVTGDTAYCRYDADNLRLRVQVYNQGGVAAGAFTTRVTFHGSPTEVVEQSSPLGLPAFNGSTDLFFEIPPTCYPNLGESSCIFTIGVDSGNQVFESNEGNNIVTGRCIRLG